MTEYQLTVSVQKASARVGIHLKDFITLAEPSAEGPNYSILTSTDAGPQGLQELVDQLDLSLMRSNNDRPKSITWFIMNGRKTTIETKMMMIFGTKVSVIS